MSNVRLRFSGIVRFIAIIFSLFTGLIFVTLITRNLSIEEYGQWNVIGSLIFYGTFPAIGLGYWFTRYAARNISVIRPGIFFSVGFSLMGVLVFFLASMVFLPDFSLLFTALVFAAMQVITATLVNSLNSVANGRNPSFSAYALVGFEIAKVILVLLAVYLTDFKLIEAIFALILAQLVQICIFIIMLRGEFYIKGEIKNIIKIIKTIWVPYYSRLSGLVLSSDILIITLMTSSFPQIAIFRIAMVFSTIIEYGGQLVYPLYIKLLGGGKEEDVLISTKLLLLFTLPMSIGIFILAKPLLYLLNPEYIISERILQILVGYSFSMVISTVFDHIIMGMEKVDVMQKIDHGRLLRSGLFKIPTINLMRIGSYIVGLTLITILFWSEEMALEQFGEIWALILLMTSIPITLYKFSIARKVIQIEFPWKEIVKYIFAAIIMGILSYFLMQFLTYNPTITTFFPPLFGIITIATISYFGILIIIDKGVRELAKNSLDLLKQQRK